MKRTNLLEYFIEHPQWGKKNTHFDLQLNFVDLSLLFPHILFVYAYLLLRVSVDISVKMQYSKMQNVTRVLLRVLVFSSSETAVR
jgi:hypothetical protein